MNSMMLMSVVLSSAPSFRAVWPVDSRDPMVGGMLNVEEEESSGVLRRVSSMRGECGAEELADKLSAEEVVDAPVLL